MADPDTERARRLAQALRDNLRRRKDQARDGTAPPPPERDDATPLPEQP